MLRTVFLLNIILCPSVIPQQGHDNEENLGGRLITSLRNDANLDLSVDEEYEDLRAELLAYHTALASLAEDIGKSENSKSYIHNTRRSMKTTPCWKMGGICVHYKLCQGHRFLSKIPGCRDKLEVCCLSWNKVQIRDFRDKGLSNIKFPWSIQHETGGQGVIGPQDSKTDKESKKLEVLQAFDIKERDTFEEGKNIERREYKKNYRRPQQNKKSPILIVFQSK